MRKFYVALLFLFNFQSASAQNIVSRLLSTTETRSTTTDSCYLIYKGGRTGNINIMDDAHMYDELQYDTLICVRADNNTSIYNPLIKKTQIFDNKNRLLERQWLNWERDSSKWVNYEKVTYVYDNSNHIVMYTRYNGYATTWTQDAQYTYSYDAAGRMISSRTYLLDSFVYDNNGNMITNLQYNWSTQQQHWEPISRFVYSHSGSKIETELQDTWDQVNKIWKYNYRKAYTYSGNTLIADTTMFINSSIPTWNYNTLCTYQYNNKGLFILKNIYTYNISWQYIGKLTNSYDGADNLIEYNYENSTGLNTGHVINMLYNNIGNCTYKEEYSKSNTSGWWKHYARKYYYHLINTSGIATVTSKLLFKIYPIPVSNVLYIDVEVGSGASISIALTDMQGKLMQQWGGKKNGSIPIPVNNIANGIYMLTVKTANSLNTVQVEIHH